MTHNKTYINWDTIVKHLLGISSAEEQERVEEWLSEDESNRAYYRKAQRYFDKYYTGEESRIVDIKNAWDEFVVYVNRPPKKQIRRVIIKYAAVLLFPLFLAGVGYWFWAGNQFQVTEIAKEISIAPGTTKAVLVFNSGQRVELTDSVAFKQVMEKFKPDHDRIEEAEKPAKYNTIIVPRGGEYNVVLSDGTSVMINSDSKLSIPDHFAGKERRVYLEGEALFHVSRDSEHPFIVKTKDGDITVLGTVFNINAYLDEAYIQTTLIEGSVAFKGKEMVTPRMIFPGEQITYDVETNDVNVKRVNTDIFTAWTEGKWIIEGMRLDEIMKQLARWYDITVLYQNPEAKELIFTGDLEKYSKCNVILDIISLTTNVEFELKERVVIVKMK